MKFETLHDSDRHQERKTRKKIQQEVHDMTKDGIDADIKSYLSLRPDFSKKLKRFPYEKLITETESMCKLIEDKIEKGLEKQHDWNEKYTN